MFFFCRIHQLVNSDDESIHWSSNNVLGDFLVVHRAGLSQLVKSNTKQWLAHFYRGQFEIVTKATSYDPHSFICYRSCLINRTSTEGEYRSILSRAKASKQSKTNSKKIIYLTPLVQPAAAVVPFDDYTLDFDNYIPDEPVDDNFLLQAFVEDTSEVSMSEEVQPVDIIEFDEPSADETVEEDLFLLAFVEDEDHEDMHDDEEKEVGEEQGRLRSCSFYENALVFSFLN